MNRVLSKQDIAALATRKATAESAFKRRGLREPGARLITIPEAAIAIGTTPDKVNDIFRARRSGSAVLRFDFGKHEVKIGRKRGFPPMISSLSVPVIGKYLRLKEMLRKGGEFEPVSNKLSRYRRNIEMLNYFVLPRVAKEHGTPCLKLIPDCRKSFLPVHELNGTIYSFPQHAKLIIFCARMACGTRNSIRAEVASLREELGSLKYHESIPLELGIKLWFLRERYASNTTYSCYPEETRVQIHKLLTSRRVEHFFSTSYQNYF